MKNLFYLRLLASAALGLTAFTLRLGAATTVDSVITSGLFEPYAVAVDPNGDLYISDGANHRILKVPAGLTSASVLAGQTGVAGANNGVADAAQFSLPQGIVRARGGLVVADSANQLIRFVSLNGAVSNLAGLPGAFGLVNAQGSAARFRYPLGLSADSAGNIYIADSQNNVIRKLDLNNNVTTVLATAASFYQPAAVTQGDNGDLWVADTRRHCIKRIATNGVVTVVAGVPNVYGTTDSSLGTNALFSNPRGLLWLGASTGLLISDSGNHAIRRMYYNSNFNTYSVSTYAGTPGQAGSGNGPALTAQFNSPVGIVNDPFGGGFLVVDKGNNQLRRINTGAVQPPVRDPVVGWVDVVKDLFGAYVTQLQPVAAGIFNNDVVIATPTEAGTQTYFTYGPTPPNQFEDTIPEPGPGVGNNPPLYRDGEPASSGIPSTMVAPQPDFTIKAIGTADGRRSSAVVQSRFIFKAANPAIVGDNAASFTLENITVNAEMWYTWDGSEPTNNLAANPNVVGPRVAGDVVSFNLGDTNATFKIRAFRTNYRPSDTITKVFLPGNFAANKISFGFENGEASSEFVGAAGQRFYAPVTLSLLPQQSIYSFQFNVVVTNETGLPVDGSASSFKSMLEKPGSANDGIYNTIPPAMFAGFQTNITLSSTNLVAFFTNLVFTNSSLNLLGVGWLERFSQKNLYDTTFQDLITYSRAHNTRFLSSGGKVILGGYSFVVPPGSADGSTYNIQIDRPSATSDGIQKDVYIQATTNGSLTVGPINASKRITVGSRRYLVGDVEPFRWFNAGDFGNTNLLNNDVMQIFQSAVYHFNSPPDGSDMFDAMDSSDGTSNGLYDGADTAINNITMGDGELNVDDIFVTFRRSLDPSLKWFARFWQGGSRQAVEVPNRAPGVAPASGKKKSSVVSTSTPTVAISADDIVAASGTTVQVPIRVHITGGLPIRIALLNVTIEPLDGTPALTVPINIIPSAGLGTPSLATSTATNDASVAWLNNAAAGVAGDAVLATVSFQVPASAGPNAAYRVHINHFSGSENGLALFRRHVRDGVVTTAPRNASSWNDTIPDLWRLRFFGSATSPLSTANSDPDHGGVSNLAECLGGTHPMDRDSALRLSAKSSAGGLKFSFPTGQGHTYVIEAATDLTGPWTAISTNAGDGIPREFTETAGARRFYRVRAQ